MTSVRGTFSYTILVLLVSSTLILAQKSFIEKRVKRNNEFHTPLIQSRKLHDGKTYSASYNKLQPFNTASHSRPRQPSRSKPIYIPPYAVKMEPLVQYSQRDPLYHDKTETPSNVSIPEDNDKHSEADTYAEATNNFVDYPPHHPRYGTSPQRHSFTHYYKEPEPIIEIIIKESNETLPPPPTPPAPVTITTAKEPIQVFYVKYKKNRTHTGKEEVVYEEPIPALTPLSTDIVENNHPSTESYPAVVTSYQNQTPPGTTYRTIIKPDSEVYHGTGLKVTFGNQEGSLSYPYDRSSEAQKRDSAIDHEAQSEPKTTSNDHNSAPNHVLENRQSQNDYAKFINAKESSGVAISQHTIHQRQNPPAQSPIRHNIQPLQFEDGSYEQPPPLSLPAPSSASSKVVFPQAHQNIPFRHQYNLNFQPVQNNESPIDLSLLQRQTQNQYQLLHSHSANNNPQISKHFPRLTQAILQQQPSVQNQQQHLETDILFSQPYQVPQNTRFNQAGRQNLINLNNELQQQAITSNNNRAHAPAAENINYNPTLLQQTPFIRYDFLQQQPFSNQNYQISAHQQQQQQQQFNTIERQKQIQYEKNRQQQALNLKNNVQSFDRDKHTAPSEYVNQFQQDEKLHDIEQHVQQPNYHYAVNTAQLQPQMKAAQKAAITEVTTTSNIQDGQIFKAISQLEEHQILNPQDTYGVRKSQQQQQYRQQNYVNKAPQQETKFKPPKENFDQNTQPSTHQATLPKTSPKEEVIHNKTESVQKTPNKKKEQPLPGNDKDKTKTVPSQLAALPAEVPDDLRQQLLSSGILSNAEIQILDYDKVGDIPIENLPPEALENLYGSGSAPVPSVTYANASKSQVEMKVVRYDPSTSAGQNIPNTYVQEDSTEVDPVVLNDSSYNRYLPLKVKGSQFPIPDSPLLRNKKITSVVVLAPVDYDYIQPQADRQGKNIPQVHGVRFVSGNILKNLVKNPSLDNFISWIEKERQTPANKQSVILLVTNSTDEGQPPSTAKEIFMYDIPTGEISKLQGELSAAFVDVAESNAENEEIEHLSENVDEKTPVARITSIPIHGSMSEYFKNKSRRALTL